MNFMADGLAGNTAPLALLLLLLLCYLSLSLSLSLGDGVQLTTASLRLQLGVSLPSACLHFTPPPPAGALAFCPRALSRRSSVEGAGQGQHQQRS
jgi:hypothetical protein